MGWTRTGQRDLAAKMPRTSALSITKHLLPRAAVPRKRDPAWFPSSQCQGSGMPSRRKSVNKQICEPHAADVGRPGVRREPRTHVGKQPIRSVWSGAEGPERLLPRAKPPKGSQVRGSPPGPWAGDPVRCRRVVLWDAQQ